MDINKFFKYAFATWLVIMALVILFMVVSLTLIFHYCV